jgi:hypothetical protein
MTRYIQNLRSTVHTAAIVVRIDIRAVVSIGHRSGFVRAWLGGDEI